jgi:hypothetical protein
MRLENSSENFRVTQKSSCFSNESTRVIARPDAELCGVALRCERKAAEQLVEAIKER